MEVILKQDVEHLGFADDVVKVKDGYARNFLLPRGLAVSATTSEKKQLTETLKQRAHKIAKIKAENAERRTEILQIVEHFGGKTVDFSETSVIIRIEGASDKVDASIRLLNNYDIIETVRTGKVVMARGEQTT